MNDTLKRDAKIWKSSAFRQWSESKVAPGAPSSKIFKPLGSCWKGHWIWQTWCHGIETPDTFPSPRCGGRASSRFMMMGRKGIYIYIEYYYSMKTFGLDFWENMCWFTASLKWSWKCITRGFYYLSWAYLSEMDGSRLCWFPLGYRKLTRLSFVPHLPGGRRETFAGLPGQNPPGCEDLWQQPDQGPTDWRCLAAQIGCASQLVKGCKR